jgi:HK97 gp10 family phage protein
MMDLIFGVPDTGQQLEQVYAIGKKLNTHVGTMEAAQEIRDLAKAFCPVDRGYLRDSIRAFETKDGATVTAGGTSNLTVKNTLFQGQSVLVNYAVYVEYGTWKMRAQPYMRPAVTIAHTGLTIRDTMDMFMRSL